MGKDRQIDQEVWINGESSSPVYHFSEMDIEKSISKAAGTEVVIFSLLLDSMGEVEGKACQKEAINRIPRTQIEGMANVSSLS